MSASQSNTMAAPIGRQIGLIEASLWAFALHMLLYLVLALIGLTGLLTAELSRPQEEPELRFTFANETEAGAQEAPVSVDEQGSEPGTPEIGPPLPDPEAAPSLDQPQRAAPPSLPVPATLPLPGDAAVDNPAAPVEETVEAETDEPPSDGVVQGVDDGAEPPLEEPFTEETDADQEPREDMTTDDEPSDAEPLELDEEFAEADDGRFAGLRQPPPNTPAPRIGRDAGPSLDERISAFGRAVERFYEQSAPVPTQQPRNVFQPDWSALPVTGQTVGNLMFESGDFDWDDYGRQIYWIIWRAWHNRLLARVDDFERWAQQTSTAILDHVNGVQFTIESNGQISGIVLEMDSGSMPFDLSSVEALDESVLPPLPDGFPGDREIVHVNFIGYGPIGSMRRGLKEYKRRGWF